MSDLSQQTSSHPWQAFGIDEVMELVGSGPEGLTDDEAASRLASRGKNTLPPPKRRGSLKRLVLQFHNMLMYILIASGITTLAMGRFVDSGVIFGVVLINGLIGFLQEGKAERALDAIQSLLAPQAMVVRGDEQKSIPATNLVVGDLVILQAGDKVPADLRLIQEKSLRIDESILTGESEPIDKQAEPVLDTASLQERVCLAFSGTLVTHGGGRGVVIATGPETEIGRISHLLEEITELTTPLLRQIAHFGRVLTIIIISLTLFIFLFGFFVRHFTLLETFIAAVSFAVAAVPEGLPTIMTIALAIGVERMAKRGSIIRRLPALETLGSLNVICSDKTGTFTYNKMTVRSIITCDRSYEVGGASDIAYGSFHSSGKEILPEGDLALQEICRALLLCNEAGLQGEGRELRAHGDPTETALLMVALKAHLDLESERESAPRLDSIPFESSHRFMATLHHDHAGHHFIYIKGAPEEIFAICTSERIAGADRPFHLTFWEEALRSLGSRGERVLAVAFAPCVTGHSTLSFADANEGYTLLGLLGLIDPPREEAILALQKCKTAGIAVKMITGDSPITASAIGRELGIENFEHPLTGEEIALMSDGELAEAISRRDIFARATPEHKLRIVQVLQAQGNVVGMTGDGVNDAPALKQADVGIAMGIKGTEVAKGASEMVITDDNFASIINAVEEGRCVYDNIKKSILWGLPTNGAQALMILFALLFEDVLPITPIQVLWVNLVTSVTLGISLAFEPKEAGLMTRPPRDQKSSILSLFLVWRVAIVSILIVAASLALFMLRLRTGHDIDLARTTAVNTLTMTQVFYLLNTRSIYEGAHKRRGRFDNPYAFAGIAAVILLQILFTYLPLMNKLFHTAPIDLIDWLQIIGASLAIFFIVEIEKVIFRRFLKQ